MTLTEFLSDNTNTRNEKAMVAASLRLLAEVFPGKEFHAQYPGAAKAIHAIDLLTALAVLPSGATLTLDSDSGKFDVESIAGEWLGGIWVRGDRAGEFYSADSARVGFVEVFKGGKYVEPSEPAE